LLPDTLARMASARLVDHRVSPEELLREPGVYVADSRSPGYGVLLGLVAAGQAQLVGQTELSTGGMATAIEVGEAGSFEANARGRGAISIGADYFAGAKDDYKNWREKWFREAIQNAVDAGATRIAVTCRRLDADGREVSDGDPFARIEVAVDDDGRGMDDDILHDKFLMLGGSGKASEAGSVGGFGKAKELLLLPWIHWEIATQDLLLGGHGILFDHGDGDTPRVPFRKGTRLTVVMRADDCTDEVPAIAFIKKCFLPNVRFTVNGKAVPANLQVGEMVRDLGKAEVYFEKKMRFDKPIMLVRVNGMYMHEIGISSEVKGTVVIELKGKSTDLLTANRDGLRDYVLDNAIYDFKDKLASESKTVLRKKILVHETYKGGSGKFNPREMQSDLLIALESLEPKKKVGKHLELSSDQIGTIVRVTLRGGGFADDMGDSDAPIELRPPRDAIGAMLEIPILGSRHVETIAKRFAWQPDFLVSNEEESFRVPAKFRPEKMTPGLRKLARFWAEMCRFVLIQLNYDGEYGVGWIFHGDVGAQYVREGGEHWLLLNPYVESQLGSEVLTVGDQEHINWIYAAAVHECTHLADGISNHTDSFAAALTRNVAKTANRGKIIERIRKAVVARPVRATVEEREPERPAPWREPVREPEPGAFDPHEGVPGTSDLTELGVFGTEDLARVRRAMIGIEVARHAPDEPGAAEAREDVADRRAHALLRDIAELTDHTSGKYAVEGLSPSGWWIKKAPRWKTLFWTPAHGFEVMSPADREARDERADPRIPTKEALRSLFPSGEVPEKVTTSLREDMTAVVRRIDQREYVEPSDEDDVVRILESASTWMPGGVDPTERIGNGYRVRAMSSTQPTLFWTPRTGFQVTTWRAWINRAA